MDREQIGAALAPVLAMTSPVQEEAMPDLDYSADPEQMIASLKRKRQWTMLAALTGVAVALGCLFSVAGAMFAKDPVRELQTEKAALEPQR